MDKDSGIADAILVDPESVLENGAVGGGIDLSKSVENLSTDHRIKKKAKRGIVRQLSKETGVPNAHSVPSTTRSWKNTRRSRTGKNRGLPKKGECTLSKVCGVHLNILKILLVAKTDLYHYPRLNFKLAFEFT